MRLPSLGSAVGSAGTSRPSLLLIGCGKANLNQTWRRGSQTWLPLKWTQGPQLLWLVGLQDQIGASVY